MSRQIILFSFFLPSIFQVSCSQKREFYKQFDYVNLDSIHYKIKWFNKDKEHLSDSTFEILPNGKLYPIISTNDVLVFYQSTGNPGNFIYIILPERNKELALENMINIDSNVNMLSYYSIHRGVIEIYNYKELKLIKEVRMERENCSEPALLCIDKDRSYFKKNEYHVFFNSSLNDVVVKF